MKRYCTYVHYRHDTNEIFYVGIGTRTRWDMSTGNCGRAGAFHKDNQIWTRIVAKTSWHYEIVFESDSRKEVEDKEIELVAKYGRKCDNSGQLAKIREGGEKASGYKHGPEQLRKISMNAKGRRPRLGKKLTPKQCEQTRLRAIEVASRPEMKELRKNIAIGNSYHKGHRHSTETKKKMSEAAKSRPTNAKTIPCKLTCLKTGKTWTSYSIESLAREPGFPMPASALRNLRHGKKTRLRPYFNFERITNENI
jgi:hypothetical protein